MGTVTVTRHAPAMGEEALKAWFAEQLSEMARRSGTDSYCGNWNCCMGLHILPSPVGRVFTREDAEAYLAARLERRGSVLAIRVGDFNKTFPFTAADKALEQKVRDAERAAALFDWTVLDRAQKGKSKKRKCAKCESSISVRALHLPSQKDILAPHSSAMDVPHLVRMRGSVCATHIHVLTGCPVCGNELLKSETDKKAEVALSKRLQEHRTKLAAAKQAFEAKKAGTEQPYWLVTGECAE